MRSSIKPTTMLRRRPAITNISRRSLHRTACTCADDDKASNLAKKHVDKIRNEEAKKKKHPSPISPETEEKLQKMEKKVEQHDKQQAKK